MPFWHRIVIAVVVFVDRHARWRASSTGGSRAGRSPPEAATRYRVLRRTISVAIVVVGLFSALLVIPQVRALAGGLLASSAVLAVIIGFAAQRTLGNFVAGLLIAITQPIRLGDRVSYAGEDGVIEEIGLTYTFIRTAGRGAARRSRTRSSPPIPSATPRSAVERRSQRSPCRFRFQPISVPRSTGFAKRSRPSAMPRCT